MTDIEELRALIEHEIRVGCKVDIYGDIYGEDRVADAILTDVQAKYQPLLDELAASREREKVLVEVAARAMICLSGFAGEGISIEGHEYPEDAYCAIGAVLGVENDDAARALIGDQS